MEKSFNGSSAILEREADTSAELVPEDIRAQHRLIPSGSNRCVSQLGYVGTHLAALVQLLKTGLEDARNVFASPADELLKPVDQLRLLQSHADALRLDASVNNDFVRTIQTFLER